MVSRLTLPPNLFGTPGHDGFRCKRMVFGWMPLGGQLRGQPCQGVSLPDFAVVAVGAGFLSPKGLHLIDAVLPLMPLFAEPPHLFIGTGSHLFRSAAVFPWMPKSGQRRVCRSQTIFFGGFPVAAIRANQIRRAFLQIMRPGLPFMAFGAFPPEKLVGVRGYFTGCKIVF